MKFVISAIVTLGLVYLSIDTLKISKHRQEIALDAAKINHVEYGLLSVEKWKENVSDILTSKIQEFQITNDNRTEIAKSIDSVLESLISEFEEILKENRERGNMFSNAFASMFQAFVFDIDDLKKRLPEFREVILDELDNYETREKLRKYLQNRIDNLIYDTIGKEDFSAVDHILDKYQLGNYEERDELNRIIASEIDPKLNYRVFGIILLSIILFGTNLHNLEDITNAQVLVLSANCLLLLVVGVLTPMLEVEARIDNFTFALMGEPVTFENQILFYQGKSILDVVWILLSQSSFQSLLAGILILTFSVLFPIIKIICTVIISTYYGLGSNGAVYFFAFQSGKWSMADVFVVAIFMAFIGFKGVIRNQLSQLERIGSNVNIIATDHSSFGVGFILFITFCLFSLVLSQYLKRTQNFI